MTGGEYLSIFAGQYDSREGAMEMIKRLGYASLYRLIEGWFGAERPAAMARRGDILYHEGRLGISNGRSGLFVCWDRGFDTINLADCRCSFGVM